MTLLLPIQEIVLPYIEAGINAPFFKQLREGNLPRSDYDNYLIQDNIYLRFYKLALKRIATETTVLDEKQFFNQAADSIEAEPANQTNNMHLSNANQANLNYIDYLLQYCHEDIASSIASVFACFYFYHAMASTLKPDTTAHPYKEWFNCYTGDIFNAQTNTIIRLINHHFERANDKPAFSDIIRQGMSLECDFHRL